MSFVSRVGRVVVVGLVFALGCGGSVTNTGGVGGAGGQGQSGAGAPSAADFVMQLEQVACDTLEPCCSSAHLPFDRAACLEAFDIGPLESGAGIAFDSAAAQRCIDEFKTATHDCSAFDKSQLPDCNRVTHGTLPLGAACTDPHQCAGTPGRVTTCDYGANSPTGTCALAEAAPHAASGDLCQATCFADGSCEIGTAPAVSPTPIQPRGACYIADGLYCDWGGQQCQRIANSGDTCYAPDGCTSGLVCVGFIDRYTTGTGEVRPGTCGPPRAEGAPCASPGECVTFACDARTAVCLHVPLATAGLCLGMLPGAD